MNENDSENKVQSQSKAERDEQLLNSVRIIINVLYALMIFQIFLILPRPGDPELEYNSLEQIFSENLNVLLVMVVGLVMTITYWIQFNKLMGNLVKSSAVHSVLVLAQMFLLMVYLYFMRFDIEFDGPVIALEMESVFLSLAGFTGVAGWIYAQHRGLISDQINKKEQLAILYGILPEPLAALFSLPFAVYGPGIWTLSFLIIIPISLYLNWRGKRLYPPDA
jgi:succinate dehydrogenase hydrophobic anchor subunit